jgi:hypothetical protein
MSFNYKAVQPVKKVKHSFPLEQKQQINNIIDFIIKNKYFHRKKMNKNINRLTRQLKLAFKSDREHL